MSEWALELTRALDGEYGGERPRVPAPGPTMRGTEQASPRSLVRAHNPNDDDAETRVADAFIAALEGTRERIVAGLAGPNCSSSTRFRSAPVISSTTRLLPNGWSAKIWP